MDSKVCPARRMTGGTGKYKGGIWGRETVGNFLSLAETGGGEQCRTPGKGRVARGGDGGRGWFRKGGKKRVGFGTDWRSALSIDS